MEPRIIFLGVANRVSPAGALAPMYPMDISGVSHGVLSSIYPLQIANFTLVFALNGPWSGAVVLQMPAGNELRIQVALPTEGAVAVSAARCPQWACVGFPLKVVTPTPPVMAPGLVSIFLEQGSERVALGQIEFAYVAAPPLTAAQVSAVESNPLLRRVVRFQMACNTCGESIAPYCSINRRDTVGDVPNPVWYRDLPDQFRCRCGKTTVVLRYLRESMQALLVSESVFLPEGGLTANVQISIAECSKILEKFAELIDEDVPEEDVQSFITQHPLLLAPFGARHLFFKPPLLTKFKADFGIVTARRELLLIEIERPALRLMKADGTQTADLSKAFAQTHSWRQVCAEHKAAVLSSIRECPRDIAAFRYLVIAGRSQPYEQELLDRLVLACRDPEFMTYDHLVEQVRNTVRSAIG